MKVFKGSWATCAVCGNRVVAPIVLPERYADHRAGIRPTKAQCPKCGSILSYHKPLPKPAD